MANSQFNIKIGVNSSGVSTGINEAVGHVRKLSNTVKGMFAGIGATAVGAMVASKVREAVDFGGRISDSAKKIGIGVEALQAYEYAARQSGAELSNIEAAFRNLAKTQVEALDGNKESIELLKHYGVSVQDLKSKQPEQIFQKIAEGLGKAHPSALVTTDAVKLLGKAGEDLLPAFRNGFGEAVTQAETLGLVMHEDVISALDKIGDKLDTIGAKTRSMAGNIIGWIAQDLLALDATLDAVRTRQELIREGRTPEEATAMAVAVVKRQYQQAMEEMQGGSDEKKETPENRARRIDSEMKSLRDRKEDKATPSRSGSTGVDPTTDALARIGLIRGSVSAAGQPGIRELQESVRIQGDMLTRLVEVREGLRASVSKQEELKRALTAE